MKKEMTERRMSAAFMTPLFLGNHGANPTREVGYRDR